MATARSKRNYGPPRANMGAALAVALLLAVPREAKAYTDPGTGALLWQMLLAAAVGVMFYFRRVLRFIRRKHKRPDA